MIPVFCHTNLDLIKTAEKWPEQLPALPHVDDLIESAYTWNHFPSEEERAKGGNPTCESVLVLAVCRITWKYGNNWTVGNGKYWIAHLELHLPPRHFENLIYFYTWYGKITGKGKSFFI